MANGQWLKANNMIQAEQIKGIIRRLDTLGRCL